MFLPVPSSVRPSVRSLSNLTNKSIPVQIGASGPRCKGTKRSSWGGGQEVKDQGHTRPKIDLTAWRRNPSQPLPLGSSIF